MKKLVIVIIKKTFFTFLFFSFNINVLFTASMKFSAFLKKDYFNQEYKGHQKKINNKINININL